MPLVLVWRDGEAGRLLCQYLAGARPPLMVYLQARGQGWGLMASVTPATGSAHRLPDTR